MKTKCKSLELLLIVFLLSVSFSSCNKKEEEHEGEEHHAEETQSDFVSLTPEQFETVKMKLNGFETKNLSSMVKASGVLELPPQNRASVSTLVGGIINKINVIPGDFVEKGKVLATLEHPDILRLQQDYLEAKSKFDFTYKEFLRQKELYEEKIVPGKKFQAAEAEYQSQRALITSLENQLIQMGISPKSVSRGAMVRTVAIKSPISGFVNNIAVNTGSYVEPAKPVFEIIDNHHVHIDMQVFEKDVTKLKVGQKVYFTLANVPKEQYEAVVFAVGKAFDPHTKSVSVHAEIKDNKNKNLLPGMYVDGRIEVDDAKVKALPDEAVISEGGLNYIFVKVEEKVKNSVVENEVLESEERISGKELEESRKLTFKKVPVTKGLTDMGYTEIIPLEKIADDPQIVTEGAYFLASQMKKGEGGDDHGH